MALNKDVREMQKLLCEQHEADYFPSPNDLKVGIA